MMWFPALVALYRKLWLLCNTWNLPTQFDCLIKSKKIAGYVIGDWQIARLFAFCCAVVNVYELLECNCLLENKHKQFIAVF